MSSEQSNNKRIAKNTMVLYLRMFITVGISFYTSRVILQNLGVSDFGLYNVIGGFISMFYMVTTAISNAIGRFITYDIGLDNKLKLRDTFSTSVMVLLVLSLFILFVGETAGLWFINNKLTIDSTRLVEANWVYQLSLVAFLIEMIGIPYMTLIVSYEKMDYYALVSIVNVILKLLIAIMLIVSPIDKLVFYAWLMLATSAFCQLMYYIYCCFHYCESHFRLVFDKQLLLSMFNYTGWNLFYSISIMLSSSGVGILLNMFFGTPINAAQGIATQVSNTANSFSINFSKALTPQITKSYARGDYDYTLKLVYRGSKFSYLLLLITSMPILFETNFLLNVWLTEIPPYCVSFVRLTMLYALIYILFNTSLVLNNATGKVRNYQIMIGFSQLLVLPLAYISLKTGCNPTSTLWITIVIQTISLIPRITFNSKYIGISLINYTKEVIIPIIVPTTITLLFVTPIIILMNESWVRVIITTVVATLSTIIIAFSFSLNESEKNMVRSVLKNNFEKFIYNRVTKIILRN